MRWNSIMISIWPARPRPSCAKCVARSRKERLMQGLSVATKARPAADEDLASDQVRDADRLTQLAEAVELGLTVVPERATWADRGSLGQIGPTVGRPWADVSSPAHSASHAE